ncbi:MAG: hypothetical protein HUK16_06970, partial [Bacteroidales bacterium]|nr:hypothetical protein [Bacteroidales bacterium]
TGKYRLLNLATHAVLVSRRLKDVAHLNHEDIARFIAYNHVAFPLCLVYGEAQFRLLVNALGRYLVSLVRKEVEEGGCIDTIAIFP